MVRTLLKLIVASSLSLGISLLSPRSAKAITINFSDPSTNSLSEIEDLGLKITGSGEVTFLSGLGIKGGDDFAVDRGEFVTFSFIDSVAGSVGSVSAVLTSDGGTAIPGTGTIEAFDIDGFSLGLVALNSVAPIIDISNLFGNELLSKFTFTSNLDSGRNFALISFEPIPNEVPDPSFLLALSAFGLAGIAGLKHKKN